MMTSEYPDGLSQDIVDRICEHTSCQDRPTLLALSRTSRAFSLPALQRLWHSLESFAPLFLTLPEDAVRCSQMENPSNSLFWRPRPKLLEVTRELSDQDLTRLRHYAPLVHTVTYSSSPCYEVALEAWQALERAKPGPLSNLHHLHWIIRLQSGECTSPPIHCLLGRGLRRVELCLNGPSTPPDNVDPNLAKMLVSLPRTSPGISTLRLEVLPPAVHARDHLTEAVRGLPNLTFLQVDGIPLSPDALAQLCTFPRLQTLNVWVQSSDFVETIPLPAPVAEDPLPSIDTLSISSETTRGIGRVLSFLRPRVLVRLDMLAATPPSPAEFAALSETIASLPCQEALRELTFYSRAGLYGFNNEGVALPSASFARLYVLPSIDAFRISGDCYASFNDAELAELAGAWPDLRVLNLCEQCAASTGVTLTGLLDFVQRCELLEELHVPLGDIRRADCEEIMRRPSVRAPTSKHGEACGVWSLHVGRPVVEEKDVPAFVAVLSRMFPDVETFRHLWHPPMFNVIVSQRETEMYHRWQKAAIALNTFKLVRRQEKNYANPGRPDVDYF